MKLWAGRFSKEADQITNDFNSSIAVDSRMFAQDIDGSIAHAQMPTLGQIWQRLLLLGSKDGLAKHSSHQCGARCGDEGTSCA